MIMMVYSCAVRHACMWFDIITHVRAFTQLPHTLAHDPILNSHHSSRGRLSPGAGALGAVAEGAEELQVSTPAGMELAEPKRSVRFGAVLAAADGAVIGALCGGDPPP